MDSTHYKQLRSRIREGKYEFKHSQADCTLVERVTVHVPDSVMLMADQATQFLYRVTDGRVGGRQFHYSMLVLHAIGRKSGEPRPHALLYFRDGENLVVCASNNGAQKAARLVS